MRCAGRSAGASGPSGLSASGSYVFVIGRRGDMFTRFYDFDIAGHNSVFFNYSYEDQRGAGAGAPIQLPGAGWVEQPKIAGRITSTISSRRPGSTPCTASFASRASAMATRGYWERDVADPPAAGWTFHRTELAADRQAAARTGAPIRRGAASPAARTAAT